MTVFCLEVTGPFACFTRPEMKVERVSYDVITPSAARAVFESILWKPAIRWRGAGGAEAIATLQGAQVVSWNAAGQRERLFLSRGSAFEKGRAIRGGSWSFRSIFKCPPSTRASACG